MPTMKEVNEMITALAEEFDFSEREARIFLNLPIEVMKSPTTKTQPTNKTQPTAKSQPNAKPRGRPPKSPTDSNNSKTAKSCSTATPRGPSAWTLFVKAESGKMKTSLEKANGGNGLARGVVMKELGLKWGGMSDTQKARYAA